MPTFARLAHPSMALVVRRENLRAKRLDMAFLGLNQKEKQQLEMEVISHDTRLRLTRIIRDRSSCPQDGAIQLVRTARFVNMANHVMKRQIYELEADSWGEEYPHAAYAIFESERESIMRRPTTIELAEILGDFLQSGLLLVRDVNGILKNGNCGFRFRETGSDDKTTISIEIISLTDIGEPDLSSEHPNIRALVSRMDQALNASDFPAVLHSSASIFETLAKDIVDNPKIQNKTLASFFGAYRNESKLPEPLLDYIEQIYKERNTNPLAGHGSLMPPTITQGEAVILAELTKAIVRSERKLALFADSGPLT